MKKTIRVICVMLCMLLVLPTFVTLSATNIVIENTEVNLKEQKIYSNATIEQDFADDRVIVVLDNKLGGINKVHSNTFEKEISIESVVDLTRINSKESTIQMQKSTFQENQSIYQGSNLISQINSNTYRQILQINLPTKSKQNVIDAIKKLEKMDGVVYACPDYIDGKPASITSDDEWRFDIISAYSAWNITTGSSSVCAGVMDTGITSHVDLVSNLVSGWDFVHENSITNDALDPHGTMVAGIIGAQGNIKGICWDISIVPLQISYYDEWYEESVCYISDVIEALTYATNNNIPIVNHSWSDYEYNYAFEVAISNYPGLYICAAGNDGRDIDQSPDYPSSFKCENMISVSNTNSYDELHTGSVPSNYGANTVHLAAPGTGIICCYSENLYGSATGTSLAAPHVTGVAALIKSIRPDLSAKEIKALILDNVDPLPDFDEICISGGRLNAYESVHAATESQTFSGDVNGDDRADVILMRNVGGMRALTVYLGQYNGYFSEPITTQSARTFNYSDSAYVGDFDGDGLTDIVVEWNNNGYRQLLVYRSRGDGSFYEGVNLSSNQLYISNTLSYSIHIADVNGDNKDDVIVHYQAAIGDRSAVVYKGTSVSPYLLDATIALTSSDTYNSEEPVYTGDFNGDGRADMLVHWVDIATDRRQLRVYLGNSDGTFSSGVNLSTTNTYIPSSYPTYNLVADVDGDGKDDFIVREKNSASTSVIHVYKGSSTSPYLIQHSILSTSVPYNDNDTVLMGDINNDGTSDMVVDSVGSSGNRKLYIYTAYIDGTFNSANTYNTSDFHDSNACSNGLFLDDVNGDGRDDLIVKRNNGGINRLKTYLGTSAGLFESAIDTVPSTSIPFCNSDTANHSGNGTYKIINIGAEKYLNVYGDNVTSLYNQQNVCLWEDSGTNEQRWLVTGIGNSQFIKSVINTNFGLNVYRAGSPWNCDLYPTAGNETDSLIDFIETDGGFKIKLHNYDLYLTAASSANGANVYWGAASTSTYQLWSLVSA